MNVQIDPRPGPPWGSRRASPGAPIVLKRTSTGWRLRGKREGFDYVQRQVVFAPRDADQLP